MCIYNRCVIYICTYIILYSVCAMYIHILYSVCAMIVVYTSIPSKTAVSAVCVCIYVYIHMNYTHTHKHKHTVRV